MVQKTENELREDVRKLRRDVRKFRRLYENKCQAYYDCDQYKRYQHDQLDTLMRNGVFVQPFKIIFENLPLDVQQQMREQVNMHVK